MRRSALLSPRMPPARMLALLLALGAAPAAASAQHALGGDGPYDPGIPTPASVLGYELGDRFTPHHLIVRYAEAVANASPRVRLDTVGHSFEGRELLEIAISAESNMARLDAIRTANARLADPRGASAGELERAVRETPAVVWLGYTVHGNEASGVEAALATLYQLAAGRDDGTRMILDSTLVLIDPVQNPDGHERHAQDVMRRRGMFGPDPYPDAMEHEGGWPGARTSHYLFDLNRDWFLHTHPETRARMETFRTWHPHVAVDLHEMGSGSTYFFAPPMEPVNRNVDPAVIEWWSTFARGNADALARHGWGFFTREGYDEFWPGYGVSWPSLVGAVGMTYEQASSGAGAIRRPDGTVLTLREAASHHYVASLATLRTAAALRTARVRDYLETRRRAITDQARGPMRTVILAPDADGRADSLAALLRSNDIEVGRLARATDLRATPYGGAEARRVRVPAGAWIIDLAQPRGRLAKAILEPDAVLDSAFIREELERRRTGRSDRFYDVTAWSLPFAYRVPAWWTGEAVDAVPAGAGTAAAAPARPARAGYAYAFAPGSHASLRLLAGLLADSVRLRHARYGFRVGPHAFPGGAFIALVNRNAADLHEVVGRRAAESGARVVAIHNALVDEGTDLGSNSVRAIPVPRIALAGGDGTSSYSHGATWYTFERLLGFPVTRVALDDLAGALDDFDVVVLPSAFGIDARLGDGGTDALARWLRGGGVLVTLDAATAWLASDGPGLSRLRPRPDPEPDTAAGGAPLPASTPGAIVRTVADTLSPLLAGVEDAEIPVLLSGDRLYRAPDDVRPGEVVLRYADVDRLRLAGYLWPEAPARVAGTPYLWTERVGRGRLIAFAGDPTFRAMYRGLLPIFANAVFLGGTF